MLEDLIALIEHDLGFELYRAIGDLKARLSEAEEARFSFNREGIEIDAVVTRKDFEFWILADLARIEKAMDQALAKAGLKFADIDAVFLTGGTSFVPAVRALFSERFGAKRRAYRRRVSVGGVGLALIAADRAGAG